MGRVKTSLIKRVSLKLLEGYRERFVSDFKSNKEVVKNTHRKAGVFMCSWRV